jgi:hypothetical protein
VLSPEFISQAIESNDPELLRLIDNYLQNPLNTFVPRPDHPELFDQQASFVNDKFHGISVCRGGNGSGKSMAAAVKVARFVLNTAPPRKNCPFWIVSQSMENACRGEGDNC